MGELAPRSEHNVGGFERRKYIEDVESGLDRRVRRRDATYLFPVSTHRSRQTSRRLPRGGGQNANSVSNVQGSFNGDATPYRNDVTGASENGQPGCVFASTSSSSSSSSGTSSDSSSSSDSEVDDVFSNLFRRVIPDRSSGTVTGVPERSGSFTKHGQDRREPTSTISFPEEEESADVTVPVPPLPDAGPGPSEVTKRLPRRLRTALQRRKCFLRAKRLVAARGTAGYGAAWAEILPIIVSGFLDLVSVVRLRQCCRRLYAKRRYHVESLAFDRCSALTEAEFVSVVLPQLRTFLTAGSFSVLNFSGCCLLSDSFPRYIVTFEGGCLTRRLHSLYFDFCYTFSDKALEILLKTPLPSLEILSLRCARNRDLTGFPFSTPLLSAARWPRFHQFSCSCTQFALPHVDAVARFIAERAVERRTSPKLGLAGSLATNSLLTRLGLESEHQAFIEAIVLDGTAAAVEAAILSFDAKWRATIDKEHSSAHSGKGDKDIPGIRSLESSIGEQDIVHRDPVASFSGIVDLSSTIATTTNFKTSSRESGMELPNVPSASGATTVTGSSSPSNVQPLRKGMISEPDDVSNEDPKNVGGPNNGHHHGPEECRPLHRMIRNRGISILINAPCSMAVVDDGTGHEKAMWVLLGCRRRAQLLLADSHAAAAVASLKPHALLNRTPMEAEDISMLPPPLEKGLLARDCSIMSSPDDSEQPHNGDWFKNKPLMTLSSHPTAPTANVTAEFVSGPAPDPFASEPVPATRTAVQQNSSTNAVPTPETNDYTHNDMFYEDAIEALGQKPVHYSRWSYPLPMAIRLGNPEVVKLLLDKGAHLDVWGYTFTTPLYIACSNCEVENDEKIKSRVEPKGYYRDIYSEDDALFANYCRSVPQESSLPKRNNTVGVRSELNSPESGYPLVEDASGFFQDRLTDMPLDCDASRSEANFPDEFLAESRRAASVAIVDLLLSKGAPVDAPDPFSVKCPVNAAIKKDNRQLLEKLLKAGAKINVRQLPAGLVPVAIQSTRRNQEKKRASAALTRLSYKSPLFRACELNARECITALLDAGADPHWRDPFSNRNVTPTFVAYRKDPSMIRLFVEKGAGSTEETRWVLTEVLAAAILQEDIATVDYLTSVYPDLVHRESSGMWSLPLHQASRLNKVSVIETLIERGADPNKENSDGLTALHVAAADGHEAAAEILLQHGANPDAVGGVRKRTPLHIAVEENRKGVAGVLLNHNASVKAVDASGLTPLMSAITSRNEKVAVYLVSRSLASDLDVVDQSFKSALLYAIYFGQFKVADALVDKGVSVRHADVCGHSPESLLHVKIQSLGKTTSTLNKILRTFMGPGRPPYPDDSAASAADASAGDGGGSEVSVRRLNDKRRRIARRLLKKIRGKARKESAGTQSRAPSIPPLAEPVYPEGLDKSVSRSHAEVSKSRLLSSQAVLSSRRESAPTVVSSRTTRPGLPAGDTECTLVQDRSPSKDVEYTLARGPFRPAQRPTDTDSSCWISDHVSRRPKLETPESDDATIHPDISTHWSSTVNH